MTADPMAEIRATFFAECEELLEALEDGLTVLAENPTEPDTINAVFRAVHSIKGGAGAFGFAALVRFAHRFETALDELRSGRIAALPATVALFFRAADHLADLIGDAGGGSGQTRSASDSDPEPGLLEALEQLAVGQPDTGDKPIEFEPLTLTLGDLGALDDLETLDDFGSPSDLGTDKATVLHHFTIHFAPYPELFASGNDPLYILTALADLGSVRVQCDTTALPDLDDLDPEQCLLSWIIALKTTRDLAEVLETGAFVEGLCQFRVTEQPGAQAAAVLEPLAHFEPALAGHVTKPILPEPTLPAPTLPKAVSLSAPTPPPARNDETRGRDGTPDTSRDQRPTVRVDVDRIDRLVNLVGELVINQSMLSQKIQAAGLAKNSAVAVGLEEFLTLSRTIQESVMMIRAQPIKPLFSRMARIVRETGSETGKRVRLQTEGENTEIDKTLVERLAEPLTHMVRNAIDHGLEPPDRRAETGKDAEGVVTLSASHRSGRVVIEVADDGGGINRPKVLAAALRKGLITADQILSEGEIDALLFLPGFSTATEVSNLSGRGVGMDVVRNAIQDIGGRITILSEPGKGTRISISLPLTLAVLDGMVVQVMDERIVVPLSAIIETLMLDEREISGFANGTRVLRVRDSFVPLLDLGAGLGYRPTPARYTNAVVLLVAQDSGAPVAIVVDQIEEQRQVVIKGIERNYGRVPGIAAATILGDGSIALILDPADFVALAAGSLRTALPPLALAG